MCIFASKTVIKYYNNFNSPVYSCFLDASKAPTPSSLQTLLDICDNYGQANSIYCNPSKSAYIVFAPKKINLFISDMIF